jgi:hypothetical protein
MILANEVKTVGVWPREDGKVFFVMWYKKGEKRQKKGDKRQKLMKI